MRIFRKDDYLIENLLKKRVHNEFLRNDCGKILNDLGRFHGYELSNQIIEDLELTSKLNIAMVCPVQNNLPKKPI